MAPKIHPMISIISDLRDDAVEMVSVSIIPVWMSMTIDSE